MSNKNRNRNNQQQKAQTMPQADQDNTAQQAAQSDAASQAAEETGANTGAPENDSGDDAGGDEPRLYLGFAVPEEPPEELTATSTQEDIEALASWDAWREFSGVANLNDDQLVAAVKARRAELIETYTASVASKQQDNASQAAAQREAATDKVIEDQGLLSKDAKVVDQGTQDNSSTKVDTAAAPAVTAETVAAAVASTTVVSTEAKEALSIFDQLLQRTEVAGTPPQKQLVLRLKDYVAKMAPGTPMNAVDGSRHQQTLWTVLRGVVDNTDNLEFRKQWFIVLSFFNQYGGKRQVFSGTHVFRFADQWTRNPDELTAMQRLINLIHLTANPENRAQGLKQVDLDRSLAQGFTPLGRQNLISFYKAN